MRHSMPRFAANFTLLVAGIVFFLGSENTYSQDVTKPVNPLPPTLPPSIPIRLDPPPPLQPHPLSPPTPTPGPSPTPSPKPIGPNGGGLGTLSPIVVPICVYDYNYSSDCYNESLNEAARELTKIMLEEYLNGRMDHYLELTFPGEFHYLDVIRTLKKIELASIEAVSLRMKEDVNKIKPFPWDTEQERQKKLNTIQEDTRKINQWSADARAEANRGTNWTSGSSSSNTSSSSSSNDSHTSSSSSSDHNQSVLNFHAGQALGQAHFVNSNGWKNQ